MWRRYKLRINASEEQGLRGHRHVDDVTSPCERSTMNTPRRLCMEQTQLGKSYDSDRSGRLVGNGSIFP